LISEKTPKTAAEIQNRLNEITFYSSLHKELRAIAFVTKLLEEEWLKDEFRTKLKHVLVHSIKADKALQNLSSESRFNSDWTFLLDLKERGRETAAI
jgi:NTE family protein